jgi:hypothetical protein
MRYTYIIKFDLREPHMGAQPDTEDRQAVPIRRPAGTLEEQQRRRAEALKAAEGLWSNCTDIPLDGVQYQEQIRTEWS